MSMFRMSMMAAALALAASSATAQQPLSPAAQTPGASALAAAPISETHLAAARDVVVGSGLARTFEGIVPQIADQIRAGYSRSRPEIIRDLEDSLRPIMAELNRRSEGMIIASARLYAQRIPEADLKEAAAFFKSPAGQKYVSSQGLVLNELFTEMQVFSQTLGNVMMDLLREDLRKKNIQL